MYFRHVQLLQRKLSLLPLFATSAALGVALSLFCYTETKDQVGQQFLNITAMAAEMSSDAIQNRSIVDLESTLSALIQHRHIKSVRLTDKDQNIIGHLGQGFLIKMPEPEWFNNDVNQSSDSHLNIRRVVHPVLSRDHSAVVGWVELAFDSTAAKFAYMDMLIGIAILSLLLPSVVALYLQDRLSKMRDDINNLEQGIDIISEGDYTHTIEVSADSTISPLVKDLNAMSQAVRKKQIEMKRNIEFNIDELRETMETIEIQNIELDLARKRALEASRAKSEFLANASHEFRTPLNGIIGFTQLLLKADISETQQEFLRTIETSAQGLLTIINDILDVSHIESGTVNLDYIPMRLETVIEETTQILAPTAFDNNLELVSMIDSDLPQELISDPLRLKQILTNLITNAIKYAKGHNIVLNVTREKSGEVKPKSAKSIIYRFAIEGIAPDAQMDTGFALKDLGKTDQDGTRSLADNGFGFAISEGLIKALDGVLGIEQAIDHQVLWFEVPLDQGQKSKPYVEKALTGLSVVVCCENSELTSQVKQITADWKLNLLELSNPMEILPAVQRATQTGKFQQLLVMDVPVEESKTTATSFLDQLTYQLNSDFHCKTILLTTPAKQRELIEAEINRAVAFSAKPLIRNRLYKAICTHLNIYKNVYSSAKVQLLKNPANKPKILAVDDNPANLMLVREFLVNLGAETTTAANGEDAIKECDKNVFDLIFMDIQMPGIDGIETTKEIRKRAPKGKRTPVVALTAHAVNDRKSELLLAGLDDYLSKPITEEQLAHVIQRWCTNLAPQQVLAKTTTTANTHDELTALTAPASLLGAKSVKPSEPASMQVKKPVDIGMCLNLAGEKPDLARDMLTMLIEGLPQNLSQIDEAVQTQDYIRLEDVVHRLRGGARCTGTPKLADTASKLDQLLFNKQYDEIFPPLSALIDTIEELIAWSDEYDIDSLFE
ncbi:response regulator [Halioxenophilus aromaticivorans]|uniref:histidine kinase n=1 Tax=Halioxenophilus aromaticivorans TaxID=1306992 RepID=A0AAV3TWN7_9ALTE